MKNSCEENSGNLCDYCVSHPWVSPFCTRVPRPMPDYTLLPTYKYRHVRDTPLQTDNHQRAVDNFQPRKQLKLAFSVGKFTLDDDEKINDFCNKFIVDRALVVKHLEAMQWSKFRKTKRKEERREASKRKK